MLLYTNCCDIFICTSIKILISCALRLYIHHIWSPDASWKEVIPCTIFLVLQAYDGLTCGATLIVIEIFCYRKH